MWFWIYFWIYTLALVLIWWFFIIAKIHSFKFKNYQPKIVKATNIITIILIILSILWYIFIVYDTFFKTNKNNIRYQTSEETQINTDTFSDLSEKDIIPDSMDENYY
jgi:hypothetical protein